MSGPQVPSNEAHAETIEATPPPAHTETMETIPRPVQAKKADDKEEERKPDWNIRLKVIELILITAGIVAAILVGYFQLEKVDASLRRTDAAQKSSDAAIRSSTAAAIYAEQQDINQLFVETPDLQKYFWYKEVAPEGDTEPSKPAAVASRILDHFEHLILQLESGDFDEERSGWEAYMKRSFEKSPVLCQTLSDDIDEYGREPGSIFDLYAEDSCPLGTFAEES